MSNARLREWFRYGLENEATHMIVLADIKTFTSLPAYVFSEESVISKINIYEKSSNFLILEIYSYAEDFEMQLLEKRKEDY